MVNFRAIFNADNLQKIATVFMRFTRPIVFILLTILFIFGYWYPAELQVYLEATASAPDWLTNIITILVAGLASEKVAREVIERVKTQNRDQ